MASFFGEGVFGQRVFPHELLAKTNCLLFLRKEQLYAAQRLGKVLGVDAIASGTVTDLGNSLRASLPRNEMAQGDKELPVYRPADVRYFVAGQACRFEIRVRIVDHLDER